MTSFDLKWAFELYCDVLNPFPLLINNKHWWSLYISTCIYTNNNYIRALLFHNQYILIKTILIIYAIEVCILLKLPCLIVISNSVKGFLCKRNDIVCLLCGFINKSFCIFNNHPFQINMKSKFLKPPTTSYATSKSTTTRQNEHPHRVKKGFPDFECSVCRITCC